MELCLGFWKGGDGLFYSAVFRDLTAKEAEERLQDSEARLRLALFAANMGTWDWEIETNTVTWSEQVAGLVGLEPHRFGRSFEAFVDLVHPEDRHLVRRAVRSTVEDGVGYDVEHRVVWPNGEVRWLNCKGRALRNAEGRPARLLGTVQDVTARKQGEALWRQQQIEQQALLDLIPAMV